MSELLFPVVGTLIVFFVVVPIATLAATYLLHHSAQKDALGLGSGSWRFAAIIGPTFGPILWLVSASVHQSELGEPLAACLIDHLGGELCRDVVLFGLGLFVILVTSFAHKFIGLTSGPMLFTRDAQALSERIQKICSTTPALSNFSHRIRIVQNSGTPACTRGLLRPVIEIDGEVMKLLNDSELQAVLLHEREHALARDPLRMFVGQVALSLNPLGRLLKPAFAHYVFSKEAMSDQHAVKLGADPLALAESIVKVATPAHARAVYASLGGHGLEGIRIRVRLLLGYAETPPKEFSARSPIGLLSFLLLALLVFPHFAGTGPLDFLHFTIEHLAFSLGLG